MTDRLTKYECSRIIGMRAAQLSLSANALIDTTNCNNNYMYIAALELKQKKLDIMIRRPLPFDKYYEKHISELELTDDIDIIIDMYTEKPTR